jgi:cold shock CspA family protein
MSSADQKLIRIGVFYDGNYFYQVSNYYYYFHGRRARISISGLHEFARHKLAAESGVDPKYFQIVDAHYFRGRLRAQDAEERDVLMKERVFDDILMREGITTHYLPLGPRGEKGIDVWFALEAYEMAIYKRFDVIVLITSDGDFVPLVRKLHTIGTRVMLLVWDFKYTDQNGNDRETRTSQSLLAEATYPVQMHQAIDEGLERGDPLIDAIFVPKTEYLPRPETDAADESDEQLAERLPGKIQNIKDGFGFITPLLGGDNLFFFHTSVANADFMELKTGDVVEYEMGRNERGPCAINVRVVD